MRWAVHWKAVFIDDVSEPYRTKWIRTKGRALSYVVAKMTWRNNLGVNYEYVVRVQTAA